MDKFDFHVVLPGGEVRGTNAKSVADELSFCEDFIVIDARSAKVLIADDSIEITNLSF